MGRAGIYAALFALLAEGPASAQGLGPRAANTTLKMPPAPPSPGTNTYTTTPAFGGLTFASPVCIAAPPGETNRLFVLEKGGVIAVITNLAAPTRSVFMDISGRVNPASEGGLLGLAFHPGYATNRSFFVFYTAAGSGFSNRVSRFLTDSNNPNAGLSASETILFGQFDNYQNHNGGDLHFGPDGYLYVALGDEGSGNDPRNNGQTISSNFFSAILRLDVDQKPGSLRPNPHPAIMAPTNYAIPPDNPFVGATQFNGMAVNTSLVRTEFYAAGLRNPWRITFDPAGGLLYAADVGQEAREEVDVIAAGGNYGWAYREGFIAGPKAAVPGFVGVNPLLDYAHGSGTNQGNSITGGIVYRGAQYLDLYGKYLFADYTSGNIWSLGHDGTNVTEWKRLTGDAGITAFGRDPRNGDVLLADLGENRLKRLVRSSAADTNFPPTLTDTGAFSNLVDLTVHPGIVPYEINAPFWSDHAAKQRWFSVPSTQLMVGFDRTGPWSAPTSTVWIKHFDILLTSGVPSSARRLETRFLVRNASGEGGYGVTYRWGDSLTNAILVPPEGLDEPLRIDEGGGVIRTQVWRYPSRAQCLACHQSAAGFALSFNTPQVNRDRDYSGLVTNQVAALRQAGYFSNAVESLHTLPRMAAAGETNWSAEHRVRSYLQANCAYCHYPGGTAQGSWDGRLATPLSSAGLINGALNDDKGNPSNRVVVPASLPESMLLTRLLTNGPGRMPNIATSVLNTNAAQLLTAWILGEAAAWQSYAAWQIAKFGATNAPGTGPYEDWDGDGGLNQLEYLTRTDPTNAFDVWRIALGDSGTGALVSFQQAARVGYTVEWTTNLLDPASWSLLDAPGNAPFYSAFDRLAEIADPNANPAVKFYRGRAFEP